MTVSDTIKARLQAAGASYAANDNIADYIMPDEFDALQQEVESKMQGVLESLIIDTSNDHNTQETARRVAKMYLREVFRGRYEQPPKVTDFPNAKKLDEIYTLGPVTIRSACSHHLVPIIGEAWIGVIPSDRVIGISKFARITEWVMARPQIQEEAAVMLADTLEDLIKPKALAVVIKAQHMCMTWRGIRETDTHMVNSVLRGEFMNDAHARAELFSIIRSQGF